MAEDFERRESRPNGQMFGWSSARRRLGAPPPEAGQEEDATESEPLPLPRRPGAPSAQPDGAERPQARLKPSGQLTSAPGRWSIGEEGSAATARVQPGQAPQQRPAMLRPTAAPTSAADEPMTMPQRRRPDGRGGAADAGRGANPQADAAKQRLHELLIEELEHGTLEKLPPEQQREAVIRAARELISQEGIQLGGMTRDELLDSVADEVLGLGPLEPLLRDPGVSEIMVNDLDKIYYEQDGRIFRSPARFRDKQHVMRIIERIVAPLGRRIDESSPMVDARLPDGSRVNITVPPASPKSASITIRKFRADKMKMEDLVAVGSLSDATAEFLSMCVRAHLNLIVSGGTGTGKTTMLNALSAFIPNTERIVTIEDPAELRLQQEHVISLEARPASIEGKNQIKQRDLVKNCLRMRPDRIIVGEVRGEECFDMLQAMNTGHDGSISTIHANTPRDALARLENMVLMAGMDLPARAIREQVASAIHVFIQISRMQDGSRKLTHVTEVSGMEGETITLQDIFRFNLERIDDDGKVHGSMQPSGIRPSFIEKFQMHGIHVPDTLFAAKGKEW